MKQPFCGGILYYDGTWSVNCGRDVMKVRIYTDKFQLIPSVWRLRKPWTKEAAKHYGHTWAGTFSWLWWEIEFYGVVKS